MVTALTGYDAFAAGDKPSAAVWNGIHLQTNMFFATAAARDTALSAELQEGLTAWVSDVGDYALTRYEGGAWRVVEVWGSGSPEGAVTAGIGAVYHRKDGGSGTTIYIKESGAGDTGWVAVSSAAGGANLLGYVDYDSAAQTGITTSYTNLTSMSLAVTIGANPVIIKGWATFQKKTASGYCALRVYDDTAAASISPSPASTVGINEYITLPIFYRHSPAAGARTYKLQGAAENNTMDFIRGAFWILEVA